MHCPDNKRINRPRHPVLGGLFEMLLLSLSPCLQAMFVALQHLHQSENGKGDEEELYGVADGRHHPAAGQIHLALDPSPPLVVTYSDSFIFRTKSTGRGLGSPLRERPRPMDFGVHWARVSSDAQRGQRSHCSGSYRPCPPGCQKGSRSSMHCSGSPCRARRTSSSRCFRH